MASIFSNAGRVLVWLGPDDKGFAEGAFRLLTEYANEAINEVANGFRGPLRDFKPIVTSPHGATKIMSIFSRAWFTRVWVLQEVGLAAEVSLVCGACRMPFELAITFCVLAPFFPSELQSLFEGTHRIADAYFDVWSTFGAANTWTDRMPFSRRLQDKQAALRLQSLLYVSCSGFAATDERDRVYALLRHPALQQHSSTADLLVQPDYTISIPHLMHDLIMAEMTEQKQLSMLSMVQHTENSIVDTECSWAAARLGSIGSVIDWQFFSADGNQDADAVILNNLARCKGIYIDRISQVYGSITYNSEQPISCVEDQIVKLKDEMSSMFDLHGHDDRSLQMMVCILECACLSVPRNFRTSERLDQYLDSRVATLKEILAPYETTEAHDEEELKHPSREWWSYDENQHLLLRTAAKYCRNRRVFCTEQGYWGLKPSVLQPGDISCIMYGGRVPYILRPRAMEGEYTFLGECYVHGVMHGELTSTSNTQALQEQFFTLC